MNKHMNKLQTSHKIIALSLLALGLIAMHRYGAEAAPPVPAPALNPARGQEIGSSFEAFLTPHQEPGEERDTPKMTPKQFMSTAPSVDRKDRRSRGHGMVRFTRDLSRAYVDVKLENVNAADVVMFHIHCGKPDMLGPILVDFAHGTDIRQNLADGSFSFEVTNEQIVKTLHAAHGAIGAFTVGCPIAPDNPALGKVQTVAGMEHIARQSELYFNLHTKGQTFYGDIRGKIVPVE